jgi:hypothetical protein
MTPRRAFQLLMVGDAEKVPLDRIAGRAAVVGIPYPPVSRSLPEKTSAADGPWLTYLRTLQEYGHRFPGFAKEVEGAEEHEGGYRIYCLTEKSAPPRARTRGRAGRRARKENDRARCQHAHDPDPFPPLLKVVALVNGDDPRRWPLLDRLAAEKYEIEISDRYDRDVSDASVGAYIVAADGDRLEPARKLGQAAPLAAARRPRRSRSAHLGMAGLGHRRGDGCIYPASSRPVHATGRHETSIT